MGLFQYIVWESLFSLQWVKQPAPSSPIRWSQCWTGSFKQNNKTTNRIKHKKIPSNEQPLGPPRNNRKLNLRPKNWSDICIFYSKVMFLDFLSKKIFSLLNLNYWCFTKILWKFKKKKWTSGICRKSGSKLPTLQISAYFTFIFTMGKK